MRNNFEPGCMCHTYSGHCWDARYITSEICRAQLAGDQRGSTLFFGGVPPAMCSSAVHDSPIFLTLTSLTSSTGMGLPYHPTTEELDDADSVTELIESYIQNIIAGKIRPNMKSERGAVPWAHGKMNKIVGSQIYEFMEQKEKFIILILAYVSCYKLQ